MKLKYKEFKLGDIVKCVSNNSGLDECKNKIGRIIYVFTFILPYLYIVEFFEYVDGHNGCGKGKIGFCWDFYKKEIELYREPILKIFLKEKKNEN